MLITVTTKRVKKDTNNISRGHRKMGWVTAKEGIKMLPIYPRNFCESQFIQEWKTKQVSIVHQLAFFC